MSCEPMSDVADVDCLVVGGGPAGLTAAIYLARFHLSTIVVDAGQSRARLIPKTRNHAGFPKGISGPDLVDRMAEQARGFGATLRTGSVETLVRNEDGFRARGGFGVVTARAVLLATGVRNLAPDIGEDDHATALSAGLIRYCPICDGYEVTDQRIGVIGTGGRGTREALFLRGYSRDVTLLPAAGGHALSAAERQSLRKAEVTVGEIAADRLTLSDDRRTIGAACGTYVFDTVYPALGSRIHSDLARGLSARLSEDGCILVDAHQRCDVPGLYAAGDVVHGLDQISHAMGEGGVAATTIRNDLAEMGNLLR